MINSFGDLNFKSYNSNSKNKLNKSPIFRIYILLFTFIFANKIYALLYNNTRRGYPHH